MPLPLPLSVLKLRLALLLPLVSAAIAMLVRALGRLEALRSDIERAGQLDARAIAAVAERVDVLGRVVAAVVSRRGQAAYATIAADFALALSDDAARIALDPATVPALADALRRLSFDLRGAAPAAG